MSILAIDPSLVGTAIVRGDVSGFEVKRFTSEPSGEYAAARVRRYERLITAEMQWIGPGPFDAIFIEGYAFSKNDAGARWLTEYGGILRWHLCDLTTRLWEVSPNILKLFATGQWTAKKPEVCDQLRRKYDVHFDTSDEYDAYGLFRMGLVVRGLVEPYGAFQADAVCRLKHPQPRVRKARRGGQRKPPERTLF